MVPLFFVGRGQYYHGESPAAASDRSPLAPLRHFRRCRTLSIRRWPLFPRNWPQKPLRLFRSIKMSCPRLMPLFRPEKAMPYVSLKRSMAKRMQSAGEASIDTALMPRPHLYLIRMFRLVSSEQFVRVPKQRRFFRRTVYRCPACAGVASAAVF